MRSHITWSISILRCNGLHVRVHMFFLLFAAFTLFLGWNASLQPDTADGLKIAGLSVLILLVSVVLHELGHYFAALHLGGDGEEIVIGPLGGLGSMQPPVQPLSECLMHLAGPLVNLAICLVTVGAIVAHVGSQFTGLLHPLMPTGLLDGPGWVQVVKLFFWINWILLLVNLLPAFPFDGGRALRAGLSTLWPDSSPRRAALTVTLMAKIAALALSVLAVVLVIRPLNTAPGVVPIWFALALLAIFLYFSARQEEARSEEVDFEDDLFGYDFSQGYTSLERSSQPREETPGPLKRWLERRRQARRERELAMEAEEERRADEILGRLHKEGMESLSEEERALLKRVSARYRQRNSQ